MQFQAALNCICNPQIGSDWVNDEKAFSLTGMVFELLLYFLSLVWFFEVLLYFLLLVWFLKFYCISFLVELHAVIESFYY